MLPMVPPIMSQVTQGSAFTAWAKGSRRHKKKHETVLGLGILSITILHLQIFDIEESKIYVVLPIIASLYFEPCISKELYNICQVFLIHGFVQSIERLP